MQYFLQCLWVSRDGWEYFDVPPSLSQTAPLKGISIKFRDSAYIRKVLCTRISCIKILKITVIKTGMDLWRSSGPTPLLRQVAQDHVQMAFEYL